MASTYTWTLQSGTLPPGLTLATGETDLDSGISGVPTSTGTYNFTVRITNDISGDYDDQAYTVSVYEHALQITPDLGLDNDTMFDSASNPKLIELLPSEITSNPGATHSDKYGSSKQLRLDVDIGLGTQIYQFSPTDLGFNLQPGKWYLYRVPSTPNDIRRIFII